MTNELNQFDKAGAAPILNESEPRQWPDVGHAPIAYFIQENLPAFIERFKDVPAGVVVQQLSWVCKQLMAVDVARAQAEAAALCKPVSESDDRLRQEYDRLDIEASSAICREHKRSFLKRMREPLPPASTSA